MIKGVVAYGMATCDNFPENIRVLLNIITDAEEGGFDVISA